MGHKGMGATPEQHKEKHHSELLGCPCNAYFNEEKKK